MAQLSQNLWIIISKTGLLGRRGGYCLDEPIIRSAQFASDIGQGTGRLELSLMEGIRHDVARGKRDLVNDYKTFVRKYFTRT